MARLQGLMFALATTALVAAATFYFTKTWLPHLVSDRGAIDHSIFLSLVVTGAVFIGTNLTLAWFSYRYQDAPGARAAHWHDNTRLEWTWTIGRSAEVRRMDWKSRPSNRPSPSKIAS